jgi:hypothetical protein
MNVMRIVSRSAVACSIAVSACSFGQQADEFPAAIGPMGVRVAIRLRREGLDRVGELYAVDSTGLMVRSERLLHVSWRDLSAMDVLHLGSDYDVAFGEDVAASKRERLALVSRFPQGLSGPLLARVLTLIPQQAVDSLR